MTIRTTNLPCRNISCTHGLKSSTSKPCKNNCLNSKQTRSIACFYYKWASSSSSSNTNNLSLAPVKFININHSNKQLLCIKALVWSRCRPWRSSQSKWPSNSTRPQITTVLSTLTVSVRFHRIDRWLTRWHRFSHTTWPTTRVSCIGLRRIYLLSVLPSHQCRPNKPNRKTTHKSKAILPAPKKKKIPTLMHSTPPPTPIIRRPSPLARLSLKMRRESNNRSSRMVECPSSH